MKTQTAALVLAGLVLASASPAQAIGVEASGGPAWSAGAFLNYRGTEFRNGNGFSARVSLILGGWFLDYDFTALGNGKICGAGCLASENFGSTKLHSFTANYRFYFYKGVVRPFVGVGLGAIIGTLGDWPSSGAQNKLFGGDFRGSLGFEIPFAKKFFVTVEGRYRYLLTNNPMQNSQQDLIYSLFLGGSVTDNIGNTIQDAHTVQAIVGVGARF